MKVSDGSRVLKLKLGLLLGSVLAAGTAQSAVIEYEATIESASALGTQSTSYSVDDTGVVPIDDRLFFARANSDNRLLTDGGARIDSTSFQFAQNVQAIGVDAYRLTSTQRLSADYTNETGFAATGILNTFVGATAFGVLSPNLDFVLSNSTGGLSASVEVNISLDGDPLMGFTASVDQTGLNLFEGAEFEALLNPTSFVDADTNIISWEGTDIPLDLGIFAAGQTKNFVYEVTTTVENGAGNCLELNQCSAAISAFGDPGDFENYAFMIVTMDTEAVPEPSSLGLLMLAGLFLLRRRG